MRQKNTPDQRGLSRRAFLKGSLAIGALGAIKPNSLLAGEDSRAASTQETPSVPSDEKKKSEQEMLQQKALDVLRQDLSVEDLLSNSDAAKQLFNNLKFLTINKDLISKEDSKKIADKLKTLAQLLSEDNPTEKLLKSQLLLKGPGAFYGFFSEKVYDEGDKDTASVYGKESYYTIKKAMYLNEDNIEAVIAFSKFVEGIGEYAFAKFYSLFAISSINERFGFDIKEELREAMGRAEQVLSRENLPQEQTAMLTSSLERLRSF